MAKTSEKERARADGGEQTEKKNDSAFRLTIDGGIGRLVFDMPEKRANLLTPRVMLELAETLGKLASEKGLRCLVVSSAKPGIFIAGADISEIAAITDPAEAERKSGSGQEVLNRLEDLPFPTIAVIDGATMGGGLELALACTYRVATDNPKTRLGLPETGLGIIPGFGGTYRLPRTVGLLQAVTMITSGSPVDGRRAEKIGLVEACVPAAFVEDRVEELVALLLAGKGIPRRPRKRRLFGVELLEGNPIGQAILFRQARRNVLRRTGGHYPAPLAAIKVLRKGVHASRKRALENERKAFGRLAPSPESKNLVGLYFAREAAKRLPSGENGETPRRFERAAVLGAGVMGGRIAWLFTKYDLPVVMKDIAWEAIQKGYASARQVYHELERKRRYSAREVNLKMHHLSGTLDYASLMSPDIVIEAVVEKLEVKKKVLGELEAHVGRKTAIASNTSSLSIEEMSTALAHPERFVGMHFFNPPNRMPLVEIIPGSKTDTQTVRSVVQLALTLGKTPVVVKDCPGFLVNRLLLPYLNEAALMAGEGVDYRRIDALIEGFGMPMGPFTLLDEIGIDVAIEVSQVLSRAYSERLETAGIFQAIEGRSDLLGKKSGKGFYLHEGKRGSVNPEMVQLLRSTSSGRAARPADADVVHRPILALLNEAARALEEGVVSSGREVDLALILGTGFPPFRGGVLSYADQLGLPEVKAMLERYAAQYGKRFEPAPLIGRLAVEGKSLAGCAAPGR